MAKAGDGYSKLKAEIDGGDIGPAYVLYGEESYLRDFCLAQMRKKLVPEGTDAFNFHRLEGKGLTVQVLQNAVEAMPMMAERTMVQVTDWDPYKLNEEQRGALIALLEDFPPYCCLALVFDQLEYKPNKTYKKLYAAFSAHVREVKFSQQGQGDLRRWVAKRFKALGHSIDGPAAEHLIFTCGGLMNGLIPEIEKVAAYAKGEAVAKADIDAVASPVLEAQVFDMTKAVTKRDFEGAADILGRLLAMQEEPFMLLALLGKELRKLRAARIALDTGRDRLWLMEQWNMRSDYPARLLMDSARGVGREWCDRAVRRCYETDLRIKSVNGVSGGNELKLLLMELAQETRG